MMGIRRHIVVNNDFKVVYMQGAYASVLDFLEIIRNEDYFNSSGFVCKFFINKK